MRSQLPLMAWVVGALFVYKGREAAVCRPSSAFFHSVYRKLRGWRKRDWKCCCSAGTPHSFGVSCLPASPFGVIKWLGRLPPAFTISSSSSSSPSVRSSSCFEPSEPSEPTSDTQLDRPCRGQREFGPLYNRAGPTLCGGFYESHPHPKGTVRLLWVQMSSANINTPTIELKPPEVSFLFLILNNYYLAAVRVFISVSFLGR